DSGYIDNVRFDDRLIAVTFFEDVLPHGRFQLLVGKDRWLIRSLGTEGVIDSRENQHEQAGEWNEWFHAHATVRFHWLMTEASYICQPMVQAFEQETHQATPSALRRATNYIVHLSRFEPPLAKFTRTDENGKIGFGSWNRAV